MSHPTSPGPCTPWQDTGKQGRGSQGPQSSRFGRLDEAFYDDCLRGSFRLVGGIPLLNRVMLKLSLGVDGPFAHSPLP